MKERVRDAVDFQDLPEELAVDGVVGLHKVYEDNIGFLAVFSQCLERYLEGEGCIYTTFPGQRPTLLFDAKCEEVFLEALCDDQGDTFGADVS